MASSVYDKAVAKLNNGKGIEAFDDVLVNLEHCRVKLEKVSGRWPEARVPEELLDRMKYDLQELYDEVWRGKYIYKKKYGCKEGGILPFNYEFAEPNSREMVMSHSRDLAHISNSFGVICKGVLVPMECIRDLQLCKSMVNDKALALVRTNNAKLENSD